VEQLGPLRAIVWAQWATSRNFYMRANKGGLVLKWLMGLLWYGMWALGAVGAGYVVSGRVPMGIVERALPGALFLVLARRASRRYAALGDSRSEAEG
jgi:hypothetical protein